MSLTGNFEMNICMFLREKKSIKCVTFWFGFIETVLQVLGLWAISVWATKIDYREGRAKSNTDRCIVTKAKATPDHFLSVWVDACLAVVGAAFYCVKRNINRTKVSLIHTGRRGCNEAACGNFYICTSWHFTITGKKIVSHFFKDL